MVAELLPNCLPKGARPLSVNDPDCALAMHVVVVQVLVNLPLRVVRAPTAHVYLHRWRFACGLVFDGALCLALLPAQDFEVVGWDAHLELTELYLRFTARDGDNGSLLTQ